MKKINLALVLLVILLTGGISTVSAETIAQTTEAQPAQRGWLGITLAPVPQVLSQQLGKLLPPGQGVMVEAISPNSPAARAGIKRWDILLAMGDQKLYAPRQLAELVASRKPGENVTFTLVRSGKQQTVNIKIGHAPTVVQPDAAWGFGYPHPYPGPRHFRPWRMLPPDMSPPGFSAPQTVHVMEQFEAITIRKLGDGRYHAAIEFLDDNGEKKSFVVEGTYDEVREQIANNQDLPDSRKNSLLNALKKNPDALLPDGFSGFPVLPPLPAMPHFDEFFGRPDSWF